MATLSPELHVLVLASTPQGHAAESALIHSVRWDRVLALASWHRLSQLLWRYIRENGLESMTPAPVRDQLREEFRDSAAKSLIRERHLTIASAALAEADIPAMLLKGAALVETVYPDAALRPMDDIDLLVPASRIRDAQRVMEHRGYRAWGAALSRDDDERLAANIHHFPLMSSSGGVFIELHQHVVEAGPEFDIGSFWRHATPVDGDARRLLPSPEDLFLHVAIHFSDDRIRRRPAALGQLADLVWIADKWPLDWEVLGARARSFGQSDRLFLALFAAEELIAPLAPRALTADLRPRSFRPELGESFLKRVLLARSTLSIEEFATGQRRVLPRPSALEYSVRLDDSEVPSRTRLWLRQALTRVRKLKAAAMTPRQLLEDLRLSRWILTLRTTARRDEDDDAVQRYLD